MAIPIILPVACNCNRGSSDTNAKSEISDSVIVIQLPDCYQEHIEELGLPFSLEQFERQLDQVLRKPGPKPPYPKSHL